jgi:RNA polymerase sigma-70 factor (ECF subfamily)
VNSPSQFRTDFVKEVASCRPQLLRFAMLQLRNRGWADDAVSETIVAALERPGSFQGGSSLNSWLIGILKHKVADQFRHNARDDFISYGDLGSIDDALIESNCLWRDVSTDWNTQSDVVEQQELFQVVDACLERLPPSQARCFLMREWLGFTTEEICAELDITRSNLWVQVHRAKLRLKECLKSELC